MGKPTDDGYPGEVGVQDLLQRVGWNAWRPPVRSHAFRQKSRSAQDVWNAFDILAYRPDSMLLGAQVGTATDGTARKREEVQTAMEGYRFGSEVAKHLAAQVWSWNESTRLGPRWEVWELGLLYNGEWLRLGACDRHGKMLPGTDAGSIWPLGRKVA